jgi:hypothetical protein
MRTLHVGLRVGDLERSLAFCSAVGYTVVGTVEGTACQVIIAEHRSVMVTHGHCGVEA